MRTREVARLLGAPVDGASLGAFRIAFGLLLSVEAVRYVVHGWAIELSSSGPMHLRYPGLGWVPALPLEASLSLFALLFALGLALAVGRHARVVALLLAIGWGYVFAVDAGYYLNHLYLAVVVLLELSLVRADAALVPGRPDAAVPRWHVALLAGQMGLVYVYAAIAKLTPDWLAGQPATMWLAERAQTSALSPLLSARGAGVAVSYVGLAFDAAIVPALLSRRSRPFAVAAAAIFHSCNAYLFDIGIFPPMAMALTTLFCDPSWPRRLVARPLAAAGALTTGRWAASLGAAVAAAQLLLPLRFLLHARPVDINWTEAGHRFSWRMKLRDKRSTVRFDVSEPSTGRAWQVDARDLVLPRQMRELGARPDLLLQVAHRLRDEAAERFGAGEVEVRAHVLCSLNGAPPRLLIDPTVDLARQPPGEALPSWVMR